MTNWLSSHIVKQTIYNQGGRKFAFQNLGPLGCMPSMKYMLNFKGTCAEEPQQLARMHNAAFGSQLKRLQGQLPGFKYSVYDFYTSLYLRVLYGTRYGTSLSPFVFDYLSLIPFLELLHVLLVRTRIC